MICQNHSKFSNEILQLFNNSIFGGNATFSTKIKNLDIDSLAEIEIIMGLEDLLNTSIEDNDYSRFLEFTTDEFCKEIYNVYC